MVATLHTTPAALHTQAALPLSGAHVLIAEDNTVNLEVATFHVEDLGGTFETAVNGAQAVQLAQQQAFDFVLMDCQMPVMDGFDALRAIRVHEAASGAARAIILAVTAADDAEQRMQCADAGFDGFLAKPFSAEHLIAAMTSARHPQQSEARCITSAALKAVDVENKNVPILDEVALKAFVADFGDDTAPSLLASFVKLLHESHTRFAAAAATEHTKDLQAIAHKLTGASGTVGAAKLASLSRSIQAQCKRNEFRWSDDINAFDLALVRTIAAFEALLGAHATQPIAT